MTTVIYSATQIATINVFSTGCVDIIFKTFQLNWTYFILIIVGFQNSFYSLNCLETVCQKLLNLVVIIKDILLERAYCYFLKFYKVPKWMFYFTCWKSTERCQILALCLGILIIDYINLIYWKLKHKLINIFSFKIISMVTV